ncbi:hypothetical protein, partial [Thiocystis violacea]|uniref:hypothetical protein n=1 Tax=Thiocystis violacea TaxID=13725 RepID=UPI001A92E037
MSADTRFFAAASRSHGTEDEFAGIPQGLSLRYPHKIGLLRSLGEQCIMVTRDPLAGRPDGLDQLGDGR